MANPDLAKLDAIAREGRIQIIRMLTPCRVWAPRRLPFECQGLVKGFTEFVNQFLLVSSAASGGKRPRLASQAAIHPDTAPISSVSSGCTCSLAIHRMSFGSRAAA